MIVRDKITPPPDAVSMEIVFSGSGNPEDDHDIVGVTWRDKNGHIVFSVGHDAEEHSKVHSGGTTKDHAHRSTF